MDTTEAIDTVVVDDEPASSEMDLAKVAVNTAVITTIAVGGFFGVRHLKKRFIDSVATRVIAKLTEPEPTPEPESTETE